MTINVTIEIVEQTYELLRLTKPFKSWGLSPADEISFAMIRKPDSRGEFYVSSNGIPHICINDKHHHTLAELTRTVAHEMIHFYEYLRGVRGDVKHGWFFNQCADKVCKAHAFDRGMF